MNPETNLWLIRHAPVDGPRGVIHAPDAPALQVRVALKVAPDGQERDALAFADGVR